MAKTSRIPNRKSFKRWGIFFFFYLPEFQFYLVTCRCVCVYVPPYEYSVLRDGRFAIPDVSGRLYSMRFWILQLLFLLLKIYIVRTRVRVRNNINNIVNVRPGMGINIIYCRKSSVSAATEQIRIYCRDKRA